MVFEKAGINITNLNNITPLNMTYNFTPSNIIPSMVGVLSTQYGMWISLIIYFGLMLLFFWSFSDFSDYSTFRYSYMRALLLAVLLVNLLSITTLSVGFIESFRLVAIFMMINLILTIMVLALE